MWTNNTAQNSDHGLPGAGKTTLSKLLAPRLNAVHFNADEVRAHINKDLHFTEAGRIEHAPGGLVVRSDRPGGLPRHRGFICPTPSTREAFFESGDAFVIWIDRIRVGAFADTNRWFVPPEPVG